MKTLRYRIGKKVKPGILDEKNKIRDASSLVQDSDIENHTVEKLNEDHRNKNPTIARSDGP